MKILVVTLSNLGDVILTLPVIQALRRSHPEAALDLIVGASGSIVFKEDARLRRVTVYDKKMSWPARLQFLKTIRAERYDLIVDLRYSAIGIIGGARRRNSYLLSFSRRGHRGDRHLQALKGVIPASETGEGWLSGTLKARVSAPAARTVVAAVGSKSDLKLSLIHI